MGAGAGGQGGASGRLAWRMAWRNLWRNRRRTLLTMAAIGLGQALLIAMISFVVGMIEMMVEQVARSSMGHIQLHEPDYLEKRAPRLVLPHATGLLALVDGTPGVKASSSRLVFSGSIRSNRSSTVQVVQVLAVDPEREAHFSALSERVVQGGFVTPPPESLAPDAPQRIKGRAGILIGHKLARQLKVELGSKVRLDTAGFTGATAAAAFTVTGILDTGLDGFDRGTALVPLAAMQQVTGAGDVVHEISVMVDDPTRIAAVAERLRQAIAQAGDPALAGHVAVQPWWEVSPDIKQMIDMSGSWSAMLYLLMMIILSAGILTTLYMVVFERKREFGVMLALGTRAGALFWGVMREACLLALMAAAGGLAVGVVIVAWLHTYGLDLSWLMGGCDFAGMFIENVYKGSVAPEVFWEPTLVVVLGTLFFALWPALRVARMKALDAIRQGGTLG